MQGEPTLDPAYDEPARRRGVGEWLMLKVKPNTHTHSEKWNKPRTAGGRDPCELAAQGAATRDGRRETHAPRTLGPVILPYTEQHQ